MTLPSEPPAAFAGFPPDVREKLAELQRQSDAMPRPRTLDVATLRGIADRDLSFAISWYIGERMRTSGLSRESTLQLEAAATRDVYLTTLLEDEVLNGGFNQYFWNVSSELVSKTAAALNRIDAMSALTVFEAAMQRGEAEAAMRTVHKGQGSLQAFSQSYKHSQLQPFDHRFAAQANDLMAKRITFIRANETAFLKPQR